jgi:hypothetical protein
LGFDKRNLKQLAFHNYVSLSAEEAICGNNIISCGSCLKTSMVTMSFIMTVAEVQDVHGCEMQVCLFYDKNCIIVTPMVSKRATGSKDSSNFFIF